LKARAGAWARCAAVCAASALAPGAAGAERAAPGELVFTGACDASAAVALSARLFAVADDEDNVLRVYDADLGGAPLRAVDLAPSLYPPKSEKKKKKEKKRKQPPSLEAPEGDLEAAARLGELAFWMTSHARNRAGKRKDARLRFFATTAAGERDPLQLVGTAYEGLLDDLLADPRYAAFGLAAAAERAPTEVDALNLEGLGERPAGGLWVGFRNPTPGGRALLAPLENPERLGSGERARFGDPLLLDLGGLGIRSLSRWRERTLILAGPTAGAGTARLFAWDGRGAPAPIPGLDFADLNPEAIFTPDERDAILLLSDDGTVEIDGEPCKRLPDPERKRFRGRWVRIAIGARGRRPSPAPASRSFPGRGAGRPRRRSRPGCIHTQQWASRQRTDSSSATTFSISAIR
jgi:hypothetical protein